jgi:hypothetical protein
MLSGRVVADIQTFQHAVKLTNLGGIGSGKIPYRAAPTSWRTGRIQPMWELRHFAYCYMTSIVTPFFECHVHQQSNLPSHYNKDNENSMVGEGLSVCLSVCLSCTAAKYLGQEVAYQSLASKLIRTESSQEVRRSGFRKDILPQSM